MTTQLLYALFLLLCLSLSACSVSTAGHNALGSSNPAPIDAPIPELEETPVPTQEPVVVSEPVPAVPTTDEVVENPTSPPEPEITPEITPAPSAPTLEELAPITVIEETPTSPAVVVIDNSQIVNVDVPTAPEAPTPTPVNSDTETPIPAVEEPIPQELLDVINDVINPTDIVDEVDENPESDEANFTPADNKISEIVVEGACLGKKKAAVIWYNSKHPKKKKGKSVTCHKNKFKIRIKEKKGRIRYVHVQTVFY